MFVLFQKAVGLGVGVVAAVVGFALSFFEEFGSLENALCRKRCIGASGKTYIDGRSLISFMGFS